LKLGKERRESSKRNYYIVSPRVIIKAIIIILLNSMYQLLNYVINERLKKIVEPANTLEPGQGGGRQGRCVGINMQKVHFIQ